MPKHNSCLTLSSCFQNLDGLYIFRDRMDLGILDTPLLEV